MNPARTALAAIALLAASMLVSACGDEGAQDGLASERVARFLPEPGAVVLFSTTSGVDAPVVDTGTAVWDPVNVGAGSALRVGISLNSGSGALLVVERAPETGLYNFFVQVFVDPGDRIPFGTPIALRNGDGVVLAENPRAVGDGFWLSGPVATEFGYQGPEFMRQIIGSEWLALSFESGLSKFELMFRPDNFAQDAADLVLESWSTTDVPADRTATGLMRPVQLSIGNDRFDGSSLWRTVLVDLGLPTLRITANFPDLDLLFSIWFDSLGYGSSLEVTALTPNGVEGTYLPMEFRAGAGGEYFPMPLPINSNNSGGTRTLSFGTTSIEYYEALVAADFFEIVFRHGEDTVVLRLDKGDQRGHAIVEAAMANVVEWFEQGPEEPPPDLVFGPGPRELWPGELEPQSPEDLTIPGP